MAGLVIGLDSGPKWHTSRIESEQLPRMRMLFPVSQRSGTLSYRIIVCRPGVSDCTSRERNGDRLGREVWLPGTHLHHLALVAQRRRRLHVPRVRISETLQRHNPSGGASCEMGSTNHRRRRVRSAERIAQAAPSRCASDIIAGSERRVPGSKLRKWMKGSVSEGAARMDLLRLLFPFDGCRQLYYAPCG
jgi:hypothetical protein